MRDIDGRLEKAGQEVVAQMRQNISKPTATLGPSRPGEFPHKDTADLSRKLSSHASGGELTIVSGSEHSLAMELGTHDTAARPFFMRTLRAMRQRFMSIVTGG